MIRLWYYPHFNPYIYFLILAPIGYIIFGIILYVFYRLFKKNYDNKVKPGRMNNIRKIIYKLIIHTELLTGIIFLLSSISYYIHFVAITKVNIMTINQLNIFDVNIVYPIISWLGIFFILEFACYYLKRETLTRDLIRGNFIPLISIILASLICIIFVEIFNYPFQIWSFSNWPNQHIQYFGIPIIAYILWPLQYLILLPLIRLFDGENTENVW